MKIQQAFNSSIARYYFCLLSLCSISLGLGAQNCPSANYTLNSQADVNAFPAGCTTITGNLMINGTNITDLSPLSSLTTVGGGLDIVYSALTNVDDLSSLTRVGGAFKIDFNAALTNVDGLSSLTTVGGDLSILSNAALTNVDGLSSLTTVGGYFEIDFNAALTNVDDLSSLTTVGGYLAIRSNAALTSVDGLSSLTRVGVYLVILSNAALTNVDGLSSLTTVGQDLLIGSNNVLTSVDGLSSLTMVERDLYIRNNAALTNVDGLSSLTTVGGLYIDGNTALAACCGLFNLLVADMQDASIINGTITIRSNLAGCNSPTEITDSPICQCPDLTTAPMALSVSNSSCQEDCTLGDGAWTLAMTPCPMGASLQFFPDATSTTGGTALTSAPTYKQDNAETYYMRCVCDGAPSEVSPVQTISSEPVECTAEQQAVCQCPDLTTTPMALSVSNSSCQEDCTLGGGAWTLAMTPCPMGASLQFFPDATSTTGGTALTSAPTYDQDNAETYYVRCVCDGAPSEVSPVQVVESDPETCLEGSNSTDFAGEAMASIIVSDENIEAGETITLNLVTNLIPSKIIWQTSTGDSLSCNDCLAPSTQPSTGTQYYVEVTNENGCSATAIAFVYVAEKKMIFANAFSPNNDGNNDVFYIWGNNQIETINFLRIYDRWGKLVFGLDTPFPPNDPNYGWNGYVYPDEPAVQAIYAFVVEVLYKNGERELMSGDLSLVR